MKVEYTENERGRFPYVDVGNEKHGRPSFRLWVASKLLVKNKEGDMELGFPVRGAKITKTEKGSFVMRPDTDWMVYDVFISSGYRGASSLKIIKPANAERFDYCIYNSSRGSLGTNDGAMINVPLETTLRVQYHRSGRRIDHPDGIMIVMPSGEIKELEGICSEEELPT